MKDLKIEIGDVVKLKHGRGFLRVDDIQDRGKVLVQKSDGFNGMGSGATTWVEKDLVESVGFYTAANKKEGV